MKAAIAMLRRKIGGADVVRISGLDAEAIGWLHDHTDYERGHLLVAPSVLSEQPARWLSAMRWIDHCWAEARADG